MRALALLSLLLLLAPLALAHGGAHTIRYVAGTHAGAPTDPAACVASPVRVWGAVTHVGGACDIPVAHLHATLTAHADEGGEPAFLWRALDATRLSCGSEGSFVGAASVELAPACKTLSVFAPLGSAGGVVTIAQS